VRLSRPKREQEIGSGLKKNGRRCIGDAADEATDIANFEDKHIKNRESGVGTS
jgi:hypothetical protein